MRSRFTYGAILALIVTILVPYAAVAAEISSGADVARARVAAEQQLISLGISPGDAVFQVGPLNYAGPDCPGNGWNCTSAAIVVQIGTASRSTETNTWECSEQLCVVVQTSTDAGDNNHARCVQETSENPTLGAAQSCSVTQKNLTGGTNSAFVDQRIFQSQRMDTQRAKQLAKVNQTSDTGNNTSRVVQTITQKQSTRVGDGGTVSQTQEAHQKTQVCQGGVNSSGNPDPCNDNRNGNSRGQNVSHIIQTNTQVLSMRIPDGSTASITQDQNTDSSGGPKSLAVVRQNSNGNVNQSNLHDVNRQIASIRGLDEEGNDEDVNFTGEDSTTAVLSSLAPRPHQTQGFSGQCQHAGLCGDVTQSSTGASGRNLASERQNELQRLVGPTGSTGAIQVQYGPEFCCSTQTGGSGNVDTVTLVKVQRHTNSFTHGDVWGHCDSLNGACTVDLTLTQNNVTRHPDPNPGTGTLVSTELQCDNFSEGGCPPASHPLFPPRCTDIDVCPNTD